MKKTIRIGTRESALAIKQAEIVAQAIRRHHPAIEVAIVTIKSTGDMILDKNLDQIGGKGLFVKELDEALANGDVDFCVHSYKDVPTEDNPDLPILAVSPREDARDVLILPKTFQGGFPAVQGKAAGFPGAIGKGKPVGCSSKRRQRQFGVLFPETPVAPIRGNVLTRLEKLDRGEFSALVLAAAGIKRLGLWERVARAFAFDEILPACGQGILAVQARRGTDGGCLSAFHDRDAWDAALAERAFIRQLGCGCGAPVGVLGEVFGDALRLRGLIAHDGEAIRTAQITGRRSDAVDLGKRLAETIAECAKER